MKFIVTKKNELHIKERIVEEAVAQGKFASKEEGMKISLNITGITQALSNAQVHQETDRYYVLVKGQGMFAVRPTKDKYTYIIKTFYGLSRLKQNGTAWRAYQQLCQRNK